MARLPNVGGDAGNWGNVLNDFLSVAHNNDGTLKSTVNVFNVKDYGAKGDGITDDAAAINAAIAAAWAQKGGTVYFPPGHYRILAPINLYQKYAIRLTGEHIMNPGSSGVSKIQYDNGAMHPRVVDARGSNGIEIDHVYIYGNSSFTGHIIDASGIDTNTPTSYLRVRDCDIGSLLDMNATSIVYLDFAQDSEIGPNVKFNGGLSSIKGMETDLQHWSNAIHVHDNAFNDYVSAAILNPGGQMWRITDNVFEPQAGTLGIAGVCAINCKIPCTSLTITGNWIGDGGTDTFVMLWLAGVNISIMHNFIGSAYPAGMKNGHQQTHTAIKLAGATTGLNINENFIAGNIETFIDYNGMPVAGVVVRGNTIVPDVTTPFANATNVQLREYAQNVTLAGQRMAGDQSGIYLHAYTLTPQAIPNGYTMTPLKFDLETEDSANLHAAGSDTFTIPPGGGGIYQINASAWFVTNPTGMRSMGLFKNNIRITLATDGNPSGTNQSGLETGTTVRLADGDTFQVKVSQTSGGTLNTLTNDDKSFIWVTAVRIG